MLYAFAGAHSTKMIVKFWLISPGTCQTGAVKFCPSARPTVKKNVRSRGPPHNITTHPGRAGPPPCRRTYGMRTAPFVCRPPI